MRSERVIVFLLAAGLLVIPLLYSSGLDVFNLPKELAFRAEAILLLAAGAFWATAKRRTWSMRPAKSALILLAVVMAWATVTTVASTNRALRAATLITIATAAALLVAPMMEEQTREVVMIVLLLI